MSGKTFLTINQLIKKDLNYCPECKYFLVCNGGCRSKALYSTNNIKEPDPTSCCLHKLIEKELIPILPYNVQKWYNSFLLNINNLSKLLLDKGFILFKGLLQLKIMLF